MKSVAEVAINLNNKKRDDKFVIVSRLSFRQLRELGMLFGLSPCHRRADLQRAIVRLSG